MKKIVLSLAGVMAAVAFAPEASALPVFARQTGMACTACHFQHFPAINGFGRAFKAAGFTMMGAQEKVEGEHLSIPGTLNMGILATAGVEQSSGAQSTLFVPNNGGELQIFFGGKVNDFSGWLTEFGTLAGSNASGKLHIMPEVAPGIHAGVTIFSIGQGAGGAMEMLNTGATSIHRLMGRQGIHNMVAGARHYVNPEAGGTGAAINVVSDKFAVSFAREATGVNAGATANGAPGTLGSLSNQYVRGVFMFDVAGFDSAVGFQNFSGGTNQALVGAGIATAATDTKATIIDGQMQGELGGMPAGFYASYGTAPAANNSLNAAAGAFSKNSLNVAGELGVVPGVATVQLALRNAKDFAGLSDNAIMVGATYELSMNMELGLHYTTQSGSAWNNATVGKNMTTFLLETLF